MKEFLDGLVAKVLQFVATISPDRIAELQMSLPDHTQLVEDAKTNNIEIVDAGTLLPEEMVMLLASMEASDRDKATRHEIRDLADAGDMRLADDAFVESYHNKGSELMAIGLTCFVMLEFSLQFRGVSYCKAPKFCKKGEIILQKCDFVGRVQGYAAKVLCKSTDPNPQPTNLDKFMEKLTAKLKKLDPNIEVNVTQENGEMPDEMVSEEFVNELAEEMARRIEDDEQDG